MNNDITTELFSSLQENWEVMSEIRPKLGDEFQLKDVFTWWYSEICPKHVNEYPHTLKYLEDNREKISKIFDDNINLPQLNIHISFEGRTLYSAKPVVTPNLQIQWGSFFQAMGDPLRYVSTPHLFKSAINPTDVQHDNAKAFIKSHMNENNSLAARYGLATFAATMVGEELVNQALIACDCFTIDELAFQYNE